MQSTTQEGTKLGCRHLRPCPALLPRLPCGHRHTRRGPTWVWNSAWTHPAYREASDNLVGLKRRGPEPALGNGLPSLAWPAPWPRGSGAALGPPECSRGGLGLRSPPPPPSCLVLPPRS